MNVSSTAQLISKVPGARTDGFEFCFGLAGGGHFRLEFSYGGPNRLDVASMEYGDGWNPEVKLRREMTEQEMYAAHPDALTRTVDESSHVALVRNRCFLDVRFWSDSDFLSDLSLDHSEDLTYPIQQLAGRLMHLPGLRGAPGRNYEVAGVSTVYAGTFENYAASLIHRWQTDNDRQKLEQLSEYLMDLGLTWKVQAVPIEETRVELRVGRLPRPTLGGTRDLVSIADVGVGVSQALPIVVALVAANPGDWIYVEQPEVHLHPNAQAHLAPLFAQAALRGVRVVIETHSLVLLRSIQTLVAKDIMDKDLVKLHWCTRDPRTGATQVQLADLQNDGSFGDWPEDFADVELEVEQGYLDAASARHGR